MGTERHLTDQELVNRRAARSPLDLQRAAREGSGTLILVRIDLSQKPAAEEERFRAYLLPDIEEL